MKLLVLKENHKGEDRVALTPDLVSRYQKLNIEVSIESGCGEGSNISDNLYKEVGANIVKDISKNLADFDIIISVQRNDIDFKKAKKGCCFISMLNPYFNKDKIAKLAKNNVSSFALELLPRITRAQSMDVLSSQSNLSGYISVINAVSNMKKCAPMMMTAAGTVAAAKAMIIGAGVAGLQAIATAKRLGAIVCAFDVRAAAKEQVESLGGKFIEVESDEVVDGVYAKEMSKEYKAKQQELLEQTIKAQDIVITTALIPGKEAPILISKKMVESMKPGSIIVDIAAVNGGNCELTKKGQITEHKGVTIIGHENFPSLVSADASKLFSKNIYNFLELLSDKESKSIKIDLEDEIIKASIVSHEGEITNESLN